MRKKLIDWSVVQVYHDKGHGFRDCARRFGFCHAAWIKAIQRGDLSLGPSPFDDRRRRYDWITVQAYYNDHSYSETAAAFGFSSATWFNAIKRGAIRAKPFRMPLDQLLSSPKRNRSHLKLRLIRAGLLQNRCDSCGITDWRGRSLSIHLDHINGVKNDNRLENLRMLCPNCHSQTATFSGRNVKRRLIRAEDCHAKMA